MELFLESLRFQLNRIGILSQITYFEQEKIQNAINARNAMYSSLGSTVALFDVLKITRRYNRPVARQLHITEEHILEKSSSGNALFC